MSPSNDFRCIVSFMALDYEIYSAQEVDNVIDFEQVCTRSYKLL